MGPFAGQILSTVSLDDLRRLIANAVPESLRLDYKRELKLDERDEKKEFLRDLTALANSEGGLIIYGIDEARDTTGKPTGVPDALDGFAIANRDAFVLTVEHIIKDGIDERLPSYQLATIAVGGDKHVLLIRVPPSLRAPHMVTLGGERRFFLRGNSGKSDMSTAQIRDSVLRTESLAERVRSFAQSRVAKWRSQAVKGPMWMMHVVPLARNSSSFDLNDEKFIQQVWSVLPQGGTTTQSFCFDGLKVSRFNHNEKTNHVLVFRDGTVEVLETEGFYERDQQKLFDAETFDKNAFALLQKLLRFYVEGFMLAPAIISLAFDGVAGYRFIQTNRWEFRQGAHVDENGFYVEPVLIDFAPANPNSVLGPILDTVWNAFGYPKCAEFDNQGNYTG